MFLVVEYFIIIISSNVYKCYLQQISMILSISSINVFGSNHFEEKNCSNIFGSNVLIWQQLSCNNILGVQ